jgi:hypothetical protein
MARRGWGRSIITALLTAAGIASAQLGLGYGLGIISWSTKTESGLQPGSWSAALVWTTWVAATSVACGAIAADRFGGGARAGWFVRAMWRLVMSLAATLGALVTIPLVAVPAQSAKIFDNYAPHLLAGVYAAIGALLGLLVAIVALAVRAVAANLVATAAWLWVLAVIATADAGATGGDIGFGQLAVWKITDHGPLWGSFYIPGALLMLGSALLIGGLAAFPSAGRGASRIGVAISGAGGPLLVAAAYLLANPNRASAPMEQISAYDTAPYLVVAGLAGSVLVAAIGAAPSRGRRVVQRPFDGPPPAAPDETFRTYAYADDDF